MHGSVNVKCPNNISKWQLEFNSAFKGLTYCQILVHVLQAIHVYSLNACDLAKCS
jgi:hypothetical protein